MIDGILNKRFDYDSQKVKEFKENLLNCLNFSIAEIRKHLDSYNEYTTDDLSIKLFYLNWLDRNIPKRVEELQYTQASVYFNETLKKPIFPKKDEDRIYFDELLNLDSLKHYVKDKILEMESKKEIGTKYIGFISERYIQQILNGEAKPSEVRMSDFRHEIIIDACQKVKTNAEKLKILSFFKREFEIRIKDSGMELWKEMKNIPEDINKFGYKIQAEIDYIKNNIALTEEPVTIIRTKTKAENDKSKLNLSWKKRDTDLLYFARVINPNKSEATYFDFVKNFKDMKSKNLKAMSNNMECNKNQKSRNANIIEDIVNSSKKEGKIRCINLTEKLIESKIINAIDKNKFNKLIDSYINN